MDNIYTPLTFSWEDENGPLDQTKGEASGLELPTVMKGLTYLRTKVESSGVVNYNCVVKRTVDSAGLEVNYTSTTTLTTVGENHSLMIYSHYTRIVPGLDHKGLA